MSDEDTDTTTETGSRGLCVEEGGGQQPSTTATQQDDQVRDRATTTTSWKHTRAEPGVGESRINRLDQSSNTKQPSSLIQSTVMSLILPTHVVTRFRQADHLQYSHILRSTTQHLSLVSQS